MRVDQIWTYPVKSMLGQRVDATRLSDHGVAADRLWTLWDVPRAAIASARKVAGISRLSATATGDGGVRITLPDGDIVTDTDTDRDDRLSTAVDHQVRLVRRPDSGTEFWRRGAPDSDDVLTELRTIFGRLEDEPLPDFSVFPPEMVEYEYPPGTLYDCYPLMVMTTSALRSIREALPGHAVDERRFRPSFVVDTSDAAGHPEFAWPGRRVRVGSAEIEILSGCPRCVAITRDFADDLPHDREVLRHVVRDLDQNVGVYAKVTRPGAIAVGDTVEVLP